MCSYEYGVMLGSQPNLWSPSGATSFIFNYLPIGVSTLYVCAKDPSRASACATVDVTVNGAPIGYDPTNDIVSMNIDDMAGTKDIAVAGDGVNRLTALSGSTGSGSVSVSTRRLLDISTCPSDDTRDAIASKTTQLLALLGSLSGDLQQDAGAMRQVSAGKGAPLGRFTSTLAVICSM